jgi:hypothetical protein
MAMAIPVVITEMAMVTETPVATTETAIPVAASPVKVSNVQEALRQTAKGQM